MKKEELSTILWFSIGVGLAIGAAVFVNFYLNRRFRIKDPRIKEVNQLIEEAERLISLSKKSKSST